MEKDELQFLLNLKLESEETGNTTDITVTSAPAEPEARISTLHSSTEEGPPEPTGSSIEGESVVSPETQPILIETTTAYPPDNDNVSIPESNFDI